MGTVTYVADIASPYQHGLRLDSLRPDCAAVELKCTQGAGYHNPDYPGWLATARANALIPIAYHYVDGAAPAAQAANLTARILDTSVPVMLDAEAGSVGLPHVLDVADAMAQAQLHPRLLYLSRSFWQSIGSPNLSGPLASRGVLLINAAYATSRTGSPSQLYPGDTAAAWTPYGGKTPDLLQFTDRAAEGGYQVDMNAYRGTAGALEQLLGTTAIAGTGTVIPEPPQTAPPLLVGTWGPRVLAMQQALTFVDCPCGPDDGKFGATTEAGVKLFQGRYGLQRDGEYGPKSSGRMVQRVDQIQAALAHGGYDPGPVDGIPGTRTQGATRRAQAAHHLLQDAIVGVNTSHALGISYP